MKRTGNLFERICSFENLLSAAKKAQKRKKKSVECWNSHAAFGNTYRLRKKIFSTVSFRKSNHAWTFELITKQGKQIVLPCYHPISLGEQNIE